MMKQTTRNSIAFGVSGNMQSHYVFENAFKMEPDEAICSSPVMHYQTGDEINWTNEGKCK